MKAESSNSQRPQSSASQIIASGGLITDRDTAKVARKHQQEMFRRAKERLDVDLLENFMLGFSSGA